MINDYAQPLIQIERLQKSIHAKCLEGKYEEARQLAQELCVEGRILQHTLQIMEEEELCRSQLRSDSVAKRTPSV